MCIYIQTYDNTSTHIINKYTTFKQIPRPTQTHSHTQAPKILWGQLRLGLLSPSSHPPINTHHNTHLDNDTCTRLHLGGHLRLGLVGPSLHSLTSTFQLATSL